jgi:16S rRNA (cytosine967-C5)-methyltransferase
VKWRQAPGDIAELTEKQASILDGAARLVKFGGRLVYATCSLLDEENDGIVAQFLASHPDFELVPMNKVLSEQRIPLEMGDTLKMLPHKHGTDGFFAAVFERKAGAKPAKAAKADEAPEADEAADTGADE